MRLPYCKCVAVGMEALANPFKKLMLPESSDSPEYFIEFKKGSLIKELAIAWQPWARTNRRQMKNRLVEAHAIIPKQPPARTLASYVIRIYHHDNCRTALLNGQVGCAGQTSVCTH